MSRSIVMVRFIVMVKVMVRVMVKVMVRVMVRVVAPHLEQRLVLGGQPGGAQLAQGHLGGG